MNPIDYRNATWTELQGRITRDRQAALDAWVKYGPGTTRAVATAAGIDLLTFRPRTTELFQLGYLDCCLLYTSPSPRDRQKSRMPSSA